MKILVLGNLAIKYPNNDDTPLLAPIIGLSSKFVLDYIRPPKTAPMKNNLRKRFGPKILSIYPPIK